MTEVPWTSPNVLIVLGLVFILGLLIGMFMTAGGRRKWKARYYEERKRADALDQQHKDREKHWAEREKEWRERDSLRASAARDAPRDDRPL